MTEKYVYRDREIFFDFSKTGSKIYAFLKSLDNYLTSCELSPNLVTLEPILKNVDLVDVDRKISVHDLALN
jgi:hypothetical protein